MLLAEHRRVIDEEGAEQETRNYQEQMLEGVKKKKERRREVDLFREIRETRAVIPGFFRLIQHSVALHPNEEEKKERKNSIA